MTGNEPDCTRREGRIDVALAPGPLSADALVGCLPSERRCVGGGAMPDLSRS